MKPIDYTDFLQSIRDTQLAPWLQTLPQQIEEGLSVERYGDLPEWLDALQSLPDIKVGDCDLNTQVALSAAVPLSEAVHQQLLTQLQRLIPWRKGPYDMFGIHLDTEWRSDWKWERIAPHLKSLFNHRVLDVGCGNGYHCWRMLGAGAHTVIGIDPSPRFIVQFHMFKRYLPDYPINVLPLGIEALPANLQAFDTTFSMGVFYHRRSPMDHLKELRGTLKPGGQLVLETLVIDGELGEVLVPEGRYAQMNNVWFLPSCDTLQSWMRKSGFKQVRLVDVNQTTIEEQRGTPWMKFHSLPEFLDPSDPNKTVEGHPAPMRAVIVAEA